ANVVLTITTTAKGSALSSLFPGGTSTYALFLPVLGLLGIMVAGKKSRKTRLRLALAFSGFVLLLALAGCGGRPKNPGTPPETYNITVSGTSTTDSGSANITLTVQ